MNREDFERRLRQFAPFAACSEAQIGALWQHYELLRRWNARINLTRVIELEAAVRFHYAESLFVASRVPPEVRSAVDVGSGAGFPGFVLAVARPELQVTLLESDQRKAAFLREASDFAPNVRVLARRSSEAEGRWDLAVSRAVRAEDVLEFARRSADWVMLVGTELPAAEKLAEWNSVDLPDGKGQLWLGRLSDTSSRTRS
jgi:16S rRNA (guanine527-N7)-methyltransferase